MNIVKPTVLSIAGFDPCGGAGILADIKTMEQNGVYGLGVITANTIQNEELVYDVKWEEPNYIVKQIDVLIKKYSIQWVKIGIIENSEVFSSIKAHLLTSNPEIRIIWDPVLKSSSGYPFFKNELVLEDLLKNVFLITPNLPEFNALFTSEQHALEVSAYCNVYLKGGHSSDQKGVDHLFSNGKKIDFETKKGDLEAKHGSGCVLSSAITAALARGHVLSEACLSAKTYTEQFLASDRSLLGWHHKNVIS